MNPAQKVMTYLGISVGSSFVFAVTWVIIMTLTLPRSDMAYGQAPFQDPLVFPIMSIIALISGLLMWPFYTYLGWRVPPAKAAGAAGTATLAFIVLATPFNAGVGWLGSYIALLIGLDVCRSKRKKDGQQSAPLVPGSRGTPPADAGAAPRGPAGEP